MKSISANSLIAMENMIKIPTQPQENHTNTIRGQQKELEHKGGQRQVHHAGIVRTAVEE